MNQTIKYLIKVDAGNNNNKFYRMIPHGSTWTAEYGRVGARGMKKTYGIGCFESKYQEKLDKGYVDRTDLHSQDTVTIDSKYKEIEEPSVNELVSMLLRYARELIKSSYTVSYKEVTEEMLVEAQQLIYQLRNIVDNNVFNTVLLKLFSVIPRKMQNVSSYLATAQNHTEVIQREQKLLDVLRGQVHTSHISCPGRPLSGLTILEAMGIEITPCSSKENAEILKYLTSESASKFKRAWKVINKQSDNNFNEYIKKRNIDKIHLFFHGSRNENFWHILTEGLKLNPNAVTNGKMFGQGIYFANRAKKSLNYTSLHGSLYAQGLSDTGFLAMFKVATGKCLNIHRWDYDCSSLHEKALRAKGYDSVYAHKGASLYNDEFIVYNEHAATIQYLIEVAA